MTTISKTEVNACLAEMRGAKWGIVNGTMYLYSDETGESTAKWNPTERVEQAIECLEAWCDTEPMVRDSATRYNDGKHSASVYDESLGDGVIYRGTHKELAIAICTALCSAIKGEQVEITEEN